MNLTKVLKKMVEVNNKQEQIEFRFSRHGKYGDERWLEDQEDNRIYGYTQKEILKEVIRRNSKEQTVPQTRKMIVKKSQSAGVSRKGSFTSGNSKNVLRSSMRIAVEENVKPTVIPRAKTACNERKGSGTISRANSVGKFKSIHRPQYNFLFMEDIFTEKPVPTYNSTNKNNRSEFVSTANTLKRHHNGKRCLFSASASKETILSLNKQKKNFIEEFQINIARISTTKGLSPFCRKSQGVIIYEKINEHPRKGKNVQYSSGVFALTKPKDCEFRKENSKSILKEKPNFIKAGLMYLKKIQVFLAQVGSVDLNHINRKVNGVSLPFYHPSILRNFPTTFSVFFICTDTLNVSTLKLRRKGSQLYRLGRGFKSINLQSICNQFLSSTKQFLHIGFYNEQSQQLLFEQMLCVNLRVESKYPCLLRYYMCRLLLYDPTVNSLEHVRINAELILNDFEVPQLVYSFIDGVKEKLCCIFETESESLRRSSLVEILCIGLDKIKKMKKKIVGINVGCAIKKRRAV